MKKRRGGQYRSVIWYLSSFVKSMDYIRKKKWKGSKRKRNGQKEKKKKVVGAKSNISDVGTSASALLWRWWRKTNHHHKNGRGYEDEKSAASHVWCVSVWLRHFFFFGQTGVSMEVGGSRFCGWRRVGRHTCRRKGSGVLFLACRPSFSFTTLHVLFALQIHT